MEWQKVQTANVIDDYNREVLHIETYLSLPTLRLISVLEYLREFRGLPKISEWIRYLSLCLTNLICSARSIIELVFANLKTNAELICGKMPRHYVPPLEFINPFP